MSGEQYVPPVLSAIFAAAMLLAQGSQGTPTLKYIFCIFLNIQNLKLIQTLHFTCI